MITSALHVGFDSDLPFPHQGSTRMSASHRPRSTLNRRFFLRASGVSIALPILESLSGRAFAQNAAVGTLDAKVEPGAEDTMRMVCIGNLLGFYPGTFFPETTGRGYDLPKSIESLKRHQNDITIFSGLDHGVKGGHFAMSSYLSGVRTADAKAMPEGNITIDQRAAEILGMEEKDRLAMAADARFAVAQDTRAIRHQLVARGQNVLDLITNMMNAA
jgi:hypothetical protein